MPRNITVTFGDGSSHVYQNAPDTLTPQDVAARAASDFGGKVVTNIDGGNQPPAPAAPSLMDSVMGTIKSAASSVAENVPIALDNIKSALTTIGQGQEQSDAAATGTPMPPPVAPPPDIDAASAPFQTPDSQKTPAQVAADKATASKPAPTFAVGIDQDAAMRRANDTIPQGVVRAGYNVAAGQAGKTLANAMTAAGEAVDSEGLRTLGRQYQDAGSLRINRAMQGNEDSNSVKTVAGVFSLAPLLAGGPGVASMVTQAGVDGYADARQAGDTPDQAITRGTAMALANYVGLRTQLPGLTGALTKAVSGAPAGEAVAALGHALTTNVGGMEATTVLGDLYDKLAPGGLRPDMTPDDMVHDIAATAKSAALLTLAVPGVPLAAGHLFGAAHALAHGRGSAEVASAIDSANPPPAAGAATTSADNTAAAPPAPNFSAPVGLDTLHNSIDEAARTVGLTPKATAALRDAAAQQDPQDAPAFVARAFHRFEANGLTTKAGAPGAFRDALAQRIADLQPDEPAAAPAPTGKPSAADQLTAIRPLDAAPEISKLGNLESSPAAESAPAPTEPAPITPTAMAQANDIAAQAHEAATSPFNDAPEPTDAQKAAGNYAMGHVQLHGMDITIENPQGSTRSGVDPDGKPWSNEMAAHYGYIKGTHAADGDHVDTFIGPNPESKTAYVIDQVDPDTGKFDEPKTILGADSEQQARELYAKNYADGWNGLGAITPLPMDAFKAWVRDGVKDKPLGDISTWKPTDERAQPDVAEPSGVPAGAGDGGGGPAVASSRDLGSDAAVAAGGGVGGDAAAPAGGAGAPAAVDAGGKPEPALTSQSTEPFYSQLQRSLSGLNMRAGDAGAWRQALKGAMGKGVKAEEIAHSGIEDWLNMQPGKVTKQQVLDYLDGNGVKVTETILGGDPHYRDANGNRVLDESTGDFVPSATAPKFDGYTLPGGKNYRELLLTLPPKDTISERRVQSPAGWGDTDGGNVGVERQGDNGRDFRSGHWDQPNVLAHVRFNDRTDADGKKTLLIEELQSDWGQQGKKRGFVDEARNKARGALIAERDKITGAGGLLGRHPNVDANRERYNAINDRLRELGVDDHRAVPAGPFVGKTEAWLSLALKRMVKYAVDHGYDRVAFTNGDQNADRYDLSKAIDKITYANEGDGTFSLMAEKDGKPLRGMSNLIVPESDLEAHVGKDVAQRMVNGDGKAIPGGPEKELSGLDLKVGGGGMKTFYDKIVPGVAKDVVRKLGGGGLKPVSIGTPDPSADNFHRYAGPDRSLAEVESMLELAHKSGRDILDNPLTGKREDYAINRVANEQALKKVVALMRAGKSFDKAIVDHDVSTVAAGLFGGRIEDVPEGERRSLYTPQPGFDITDKMRAAAADGVPLFKQSGDTIRRGVDPAALRSEVTRIQAGWKDAPPVHVVDDVSGLPGHIQDSLQSQGAQGQTQALLMPGKGGDPGDVYLIANRLKDAAEAQKALFHEVLGHYGIRKVLGSDAVYSAEMYKLRQANPKLTAEAEAWMQKFGQGAIAARVQRGVSLEVAMKNVRALSTEEALADRAGKGEPIRGLQSLMAKIQQWLRSVGLDKVADHLEGLTQAETASLLARARSAVEAPEEGRPARAGDEPSMALASRAVREEGIPQEAQELGGGASVAQLKAHPDYAAAKAGDTEAAVRLVNDLVTPQDIEAAKKLGPDIVYAFPHAEEASGRNAIPLTLAHKYALETGGSVEAPIVQTNRVFHTGADAMQRLASRPLFDGQVQRGRKYVVVDDVSTMGSTLAELADHIRAGGGDVVGVGTLADASRAPTMVAPKRQTAEIESRYGQTVRDELHVDPRALTGAEAGYLIGFRNADELRNRVAAARRDQEERAGARTLREGGDLPLLSQRASDDEAAAPDIPKSHVADALDKVREAGAKFADTMKTIRDDALLKTVPMALGTPETRTVAKDFANADRLARWQWGKFDDVLTKNYDEAQRRDMFNASDEQSVLLQQGKKVGADEGLNSLSPDERKTVETLQGYGNGLLQRARDAGMFEGEGIPSWTPRMAVMVDGRGGFSRPAGTGAETGAKQGRNIVTTASSLKARKYLTSAETEAAMKGKLGDGAQLVRDIRVMPLAMARLEKAIAGRELINQIKAMGDRAGLETVSSSEKDGFFTVDHPAFKTWQATTGEDGTKSWEAKPLYVNKAFQGPLKAVMSETPGPVYSALMALKAKSMGLIMYSPLIHNAVEWGRALPAMPGKVATFQIYFEGNRIKNDPVQMRQAISDGLVPIGKRGGIQDITGIMEDPSLTPGRSWTAKLIGGALGLANEKAGTLTKKGIDAAGDLWHNTLLWDRVGDLQAGLYGALREKEIQKGTDPAAAGKLAAHFANRFAGALPNEAMSAGARKIANILMFSRTFTLGNMGLMKDMVTGLPRDIQSQIRTASGDLAAAAATSRARRIAIASFIVDIGLMYVGNSVLQSTIEHLKGKKSWGEVGQGYLDRLHKLLQRTGDHPLETLSNPFDMANSLSSTSANEPGKEDRVRVGTQDDGTAIYLRLPTGKVGEDFKNWITKPLVTAKAKESQLVRPLQAVWTNDNGIGQRIYDPDAKGLGGVLSNAGRIAKLFATQAIPADAIQGAMDWKSGKASDVDKLKVAGPLAGLTFSKGAPGGPAVGQMYDADRRFEGAKMDVMPDVKAAIKAGDDGKAIALLEGIKMQPSEIMRTLRHLEMPESRLSAGAFKHFAQHASDDDMERMNDLLGAEKAREPAPAQP